MQLSIPYYTGQTRSGTVTIAGINYTVTQGITAVTPNLAADFGSQGLWMLQNGTWKQISAASPDKLATYAQKIVASFPGSGVYQYDGTTLTRISSNGSVQNMVGSDAVYVDTGVLSRWNGTWTSLSGADPKNMAASGSLLYVDFSPWGLWQWNGTSWAQINNGSPVSMVASGTNLYADYGVWGLWRWNGTTWAQLSPSAPTDMAASGQNLYVGFGVWGVWQWNGSSWAVLSSQIAHKITVTGN